MDAAGKVDLSGGWVSLYQASVELKTSRLMVLQLAVKGDLEAQHVAGRTVISRASLDRVLTDRAASDTSHSAS